MFKFIYKLNLIFLFLTTIVFAEVLKDIKVSGNQRISLETIKVLGDIEIGKDYTQEGLNNIVKVLYETNFFKTAELELNNNTLFIKIVENPIIENIEITGVENDKLKDGIYEYLQLKRRNSFVEFILKKDVDKIKNILKTVGYYFADVKTLVVRNEEKNSINIEHQVTLGSKAEISEISFIGNKVFKDRKLRNLITSEETKFWKFLSKNVYLNEQRIRLDSRLINTFYKNEGYYKAKVVNSFVEMKQDNSFKLLFNIDAGEKYFFENIKIVIPDNFEKEYFSNLKDKALKLKGKEYSLNKIDKVLNEVDKIALSKQYEFINAKISETITGNNKINFIITMEEANKFYVEKINILGNQYTKEEVLRNSFIVDEGDPYNEILFDKSINKIKAKGIFKVVKKEIKGGTSPNMKIVDIIVEEKPTGEISLGAGYGTTGATIGGGIKEKNFMGSGISVDTNIAVSEETLKGKVSIVQPNFRYSDNTLFSSIESSTTDKLADSGYKTSNFGSSIGTQFQQYENFYFSPSLSVKLEDLKTSSNATKSLKKQEGNYFDTLFNYTINYDLRDKAYQPTSGYQTYFTQSLPLISDNSEIINSIDITNYHKIADNMITKISLFGKAANTLSNEDVRISKRLYIPNNKLRGFEKGKVGPKDGLDFIGGNYLTALNLSTTLPSILPEVQNVDFNLFVDVASVWGVDYSDSIDDASYIRSAAGVAVDYFSPIGPINFSLSQPISKRSTDITETFRFQIGTTF